MDYPVEAICHIIRGEVQREMGSLPPSACNKSTDEVLQQIGHDNSIAPTLTSAAYVS